MTVNDAGTKITYQGNGSTKQWPFSFAGGPDPDIEVFLTDAAGVIIEVNSNLEIIQQAPIDPNPTSIGGVVIYPSSGAPLPIGNKITIVRVVPLNQPSSFSNQSILYQEVVEEAFDYEEMQIQQLREQLNRTLQVRISEPDPKTLPSIADRAGNLLGFDSNGDPVVGGPFNQIATSNAIRVPPPETVPALPVASVRAGTILGFDNAGNPILLGFSPDNIPPNFGTRVTVISNTTVTNAQKGFMFQLGGNVLFDLSFGDPTTYDPDFSATVVNVDIYNGPGSGRAKRIILNGVPMFGSYIWPGQMIFIYRVGNAWSANPRIARWRPGSAVTFYADNTFGSDAGDGLAPGSGAFASVNKALAVSATQTDPGALAVVIQLAPGTYTESVFINFTEVGVPIMIKGADDGADPTPYLWQVPTGTNIGVAVDNASSVSVKGIYFASAVGGSGQWALSCLRGSVMNISNCRFGIFPGNSILMHCYDCSAMTIIGVNITGNCGAALVVRGQSIARLGGVWSVAGGLTWVAFMSAFYGSTIVGGNIANSYDATNFSVAGGAGCVGYKYKIQQNSVLNLGRSQYADLGLPGSLGGICGDPNVLRGTDSSCVFPLGEA